MFTDLQEPEDNFIEDGEFSVSSTTPCTTTTEETTTEITTEAITDLPLASNPIEDLDAVQVSTGFAHKISSSQDILQTFETFENIRFF